MISLTGREQERLYTKGKPGRSFEILDLVEDERRLFVGNDATKLLRVVV